MADANESLGVLPNIPQSLTAMLEREHFLKKIVLNLLTLKVDKSKVMLSSHSKSEEDDDDDDESSDSSSSPHSTDSGVEAGCESGDDRERHYSDSLSGEQYTCEKEETFYSELQIILDKCLEHDAFGEHSPLFGEWHSQLAVMRSALRNYQLEQSSAALQSLPVIRTSKPEVGPVQKIVKPHPQLKSPFQQQHPNQHLNYFQPNHLQHLQHHHHQQYSHFEWSPINYNTNHLNAGHSVPNNNNSNQLQHFRRPSNNVNKSILSPIVSINEHHFNPQWNALPWLEKVRSLLFFWNTSGHWK